jgi:hypothetical protein
MEMEDNKVEMLFNMLRDIRASQQSTDRWLEEINVRLTNLENHMLLAHRADRHQDEGLAEVRVRLDRVERQLNLTDQPQG